MDNALESLTRLRVDRSGAQAAPHQPCLLLALICEIQAGHIDTPSVTIDERLLARYHDIFEKVTGERQRARAWMPLWALRNREGPSGTLWRPHYLDPVRLIIDQLGQPKSLKQLEQRFISATLDPVLFSTLQDPALARQACSLLVNHYLADDHGSHERLVGYFEAQLDSGEYQRHPERLAEDIKETSQRYARSAAFRSLVLDAYDYRCAASGLRYITPDYRYLVEAAHLIPFAERQDDRPVNGLALTPNLHWAMDSHLIAPGPDHRWHVSPTVDARVPDNRWLCDLDAQPLMLPRNGQWHPDTQGLEWRMDHLLR